MARNKFLHTFYPAAPLLALFSIVTPVLASAQSQSPVVSAPAHELHLSVDPAQSSVHWTLPTALHTVHGTFNLRRGSLTVDPASGHISGEIVAAAASGESGNASRDSRMHAEILESSRYSDVSFRPDRLEGQTPGQGSSDFKLHGIFSLHGADHEITVPVHAEIAAANWKGSAKFTIPYVQWGLKDPSRFVLRVNPAVEIELQLAGKLAAGPQ